MAILRRSVRMTILLLGAGVGLMGGRLAAAGLYKHVTGGDAPLANVAYADVPATGTSGTGGTTGDGDGGGDGGGGDGGGDCDGGGDGGGDCD